MTVRDPFRWLEDRSRPETDIWVREQRRRCQAYFETCPGLPQLERRVQDYLDVEAVDQPARVVDRYFYRKRRQGEEQGSLYVRDVGTPDERLLIDRSPEERFTSIGIHCIAEDGNLLAIEVGQGGGDRREILILDVRSGLIRPDRVPSGYPRGFAFNRESNGFLYAQESENRASEHLIRLHHLGQGGEDEILFRVPRSAGSRLSLMANDLLSGAYWLRQQGSVWMGDLWVAPSSNVYKWSKFFMDKRLPFCPIVCQDRILALVEADSKLTQIVELSEKGEVMRVLAPEGRFPIRQFVVTRDRIYLSRGERGISHIEVWDTAGQQLAKIELPENGTIRLFPVHTQRADGFFYRYESFDLPPATYEYDPKTGTSTLWYQQGRTCPGRRSWMRERSFASKDGTIVPLTLVARRGYACDRPSPVIMTGYGGFGVTMTPQFSVLVTIMMELGAVLAVPHLRGGGEFGQAWHDAGRARDRQVSFDDFIAAAEWLGSQRICATRQLAIFGGSNAGLLVAAAMTQRPDLFGAVLCIAPLLDMVRYESFDQAVKWQHEYGSSQDPEDFRALYAYSPYHHVSDAVDYPPTLFVTGDKDDRCNPAHVRKMAAALQVNKSQRSPVIVDYSEERGHTPVLPLSVRVKALARRIAFLCRGLDIPLPMGGADAASCP